MKLFNKNLPIAQSLADELIRPVTRVQLVLGAATFFLLTANATFFSQMLSVYPLEWGNLGALLATTVVLWTLTVVMLCVLCVPGLTRITLTATFILAALVSYFSEHFGVAVSHEMIDNVAQTSSGEANDLVTWELLLRTFVLGVAPAVLVLKVPIKAQSLWVDSRNLGALALAGVVLMGACLFSYSDHFASLFREHRSLRYYANPAFPIYSMVRWTKGTNTPSEIISFENPGAIAATDVHTELVVMVVGETARADHFSLNGYPRTTNPTLASTPNVYSFSDVQACGTSTAVSVPCMFSLEGQSVGGGRQYENALDVLQAMGVAVLWRDNNTGSKGVADRVEFETFAEPSADRPCDGECRDIALLRGLQEYIDEQSGDILIVLHQKGNHGPAYFKRYPAEFERFTPACRSAQLSDCTDSEITNAYDNAILYTDHFLGEVIELLKRNSARYETTMLYVSDHGESLGENGIYLHGLPKAIAPAAQLHVPMIVWTGASSDVDLTTLKGRQARPHTHEAIFHSLLELFEADSRLLDREKAAFQVRDEHVGA